MRSRVRAVCYSIRNECLIHTIQPYDRLRLNLDRRPAQLEKEQMPKAHKTLPALAIDHRKSSLKAGE